MINPCAIIQARMGSSRLPGKVIQKINGVTLLERLISRVRKSYFLNNIYVATPPDLVIEKPIHDICRALDIKFYVGSENNVLKRYWYGANKYDIDPVIRITSDCPLIDPDIIDETINMYYMSDCDYFTNSSKMDNYLGSLAYPSGMNVEVISKNLLRSLNNLVTEPDLQEHVTAALRSPKYVEMLKPIIGELSIGGMYKNLKLSVDTKEDLEYIKNIVINLESVTPNYTMNDILIYLMSKGLYEQ